MPVNKNDTKDVHVDIENAGPEELISKKEGISEQENEWTDHDSPPVKFRIPAKESGKQVKGGGGHYGDLPREK